MIAVGLFLWQNSHGRKGEARRDGKNENAGEKERAKGHGAAESGYETLMSLGYSLLKLSLCSIDFDAFITLTQAEMCQLHWCTDLM